MHKSHTPLSLALSTIHAWKQRLAPSVGLILRSTAWLSGGQIVTILSSLATSVILARALGPAGFGVFGLVNMVVSLGVQFSAFGTDQNVQRRIAVAPDQQDELAWMAFYVRLLGTIFVTPLTFAAMYWSIGDTLPLGSLMACAFATAVSTSDAFMAIYFAHTKGKHAATVHVFTAIFALFSRTCLVLLNAPLHIIVLSILAEQIATTIFLFWRLTSERALRSFHRPDPIIIRSLFREGWVVLVSQVGIAIYMRIDLFMVEAIRSQRELGLYIAAARIAEISFFLPTMICRSLMPTLAKAHRDDIDSYRRGLKVAYGLFFWAGIAIGLVATLLSGVIIHLLYGESFAAAAPVLSLSIWAGLWISYGGLTRIATNIEGTQFVLMCGTIAGAILNVGLNLVFIPQWGIAGAALATLVSYSLPAWLIALFFRRTRPLFILMTLAPAQMAIQAVRFTLCRRNVDREN